MGPGGLSMSRKQLKFVQISRKQVVQLELHPFLTASHVEKFPRNWFQNEHMQEVEVLLKQVLARYDVFDPKALKPVKDKDTIKQDCLVGQSIRLGFMLKPKAERHSLLTGSAGGRKSSVIRNVKLVAYVCPRQHGNNTCITSAFSQLLKEERKTDQSEISSYFLRNPEKQTTNSNTTTVNASSSNRAVNTTSRFSASSLKHGDSCFVGTAASPALSSVDAQQNSAPPSPKHAQQIPPILSPKHTQQNPPSPSPNHAQQNLPCQSCKHNQQNPLHLNPKHTMQNAGAGVLSQRPGGDFTTAGSSVVSAITSDGPTAAAVTHSDGASVELTELGSWQSGDEEHTPEVNLVTTEDGPEELMEDRKKAALKNMMQRRAQKRQLSRKKKHSQNKEVVNPLSITKSFKRQLSSSHHQHNHATNLTRSNSYTYVVKNKGENTPNGTLQIDDHELPAISRRPRVSGSHQGPLDGGFSGELAQGELSEDMELPAIVAPKVRKGQTSKGSVCASSAFPSNPVEKEELPDIIGPDSEQPILPQHTNKEKKKQSVLKTSKSHTQAKKYVSASSEEKNSCDEPTTKLNNSAASDKPCSPRPTTKLNNSAASGKPCSPRPTTKLSSSAASGKPCSPRPTTKLNNSAASDKPCSPKPTTKLNNSAASGKPCSPRPTTKLNNSAASGKPCSPRPTTKLNNSAASGKPCSPRPTTKLSNSPLPLKPCSVYLIDLSFGSSLSSSSPEVAQQRKCTMTAGYGEKLRDSALSRKNYGNLRDYDSNLFHDKGTPVRSKDATCFSSSLSDSGSVSPLSSPDVVRKTKSSVASKTGQPFLCSSASAVKDCKSSSTAHMLRDKGLSRLRGKACGTKSSSGERSASCNWIHSDKSSSPCSQSSGDRLDLHPRPPQADCHRPKSSAAGLSTWQQSRLSPGPSSVSPTWNDSDPQEGLSGSQSPAYTDSAPQRVKKLKHSTQRREPVHCLTTPTKPTAANDASSEGFAGKRSKPPSSSSSSSPASSPSSVSLLSPKSAGHSRVLRHGVETHKLQPKNCSKPLDLSQSGTFPKSTSEVSSDEIQLTQTVPPSVIHNSVLSGWRSTQKTNCTGSKGMDRETESCEQLEHIAATGSRSRPRTQHPQVTNSLQKPTDVSRDMTGPGTLTLDISEEEARNNGYCDQNALCVQDDTRDCFVVENGEADVSQPASPGRGRSPVFTRKRRSHPSPEENSSGATAKRQRLQEVDRILVMNLAENSREGASQSSTSKKHREILSLSDEELRRRVMGLKSDLTAIYTGRLHSDRHKHYMEGGNSRRLLDHDGQLQCVQEGQEDLVMDILLTMFTSSKLKDLDYLMRVMLPEALMMVHNQVSKHS